MAKQTGRWTWTIGMGVAMLLCSAVVVSAQSLADVARQEEARRKAVKKPAKVLTNDSLQSVASDVVPAPSATPPADASVPSTDHADPTPASPPATADSAAADPRKTQEYWKRRMEELVKERDNNALMLDALQSRANGLWADFTARDNPIERSAIAVDRQKTLDELERRKTLRGTLEQKLRDLEDEARKANVPPGWLR